MPTTRCTAIVTMEGRRYVSQHYLYGIAGERSQHQIACQAIDAAARELYGRDDLVCLWVNADSNPQQIVLRDDNHTFESPVLAVQVQLLDVPPGHLANKKDGA